jgi:uncharacterized protein YqhQ
MHLGPLPQPSPYPEQTTPPPYGRPPRISGMAMPGGVHLAISVYGSGASWQLAASGLALVGVMALAALPAYVTAWAIEHFTGLPVASAMLQFPVLADPVTFAVADVLRGIVWLGSFMSLLWLSPLSGYHAAEHQTVACIERFGDVIPELVAQMPRAHVRCGTNWLAGVLPLFVIGVPLWRVAPGLTVIAGLLGLYFRHYIGYFLQQYLTTRPPSAAQLRAGIQAGRKVMAAWRGAQPERITPLAAAWHRGFPQTLVGVFLGTFLMNLLYDHLHIFLDW